MEYDLHLIGIEWRRYAYGRIDKTDSQFLDALHSHPPRRIIPILVTIRLIPLLLNNHRLMLIWLLLLVLLLQFVVIIGLGQ